MSTTMTDLIGLGGTPLDATETTNVATSLAGAGNSFGELIAGVAKGAADTNLKLTENSADITSKLAGTMVDVIAVQETNYDDAGNITGSTSHVQQLPLLTLIDPPFYSFPRIRIEGVFQMTSFATDTSSSVDTSSSSFGAGFSLSRTPTLFGTRTTVGGGAGASSSSASTDVSTQNKQSTAVGQMRLYAQLKPESFSIPKPVQVVIGPSLSLIEGEITEEDDENQNTIRTMSVLIQFRNKTGDPIKGKAISIEVDGALWNFADPAKTTTGTTAPDEGNLAIELKRVFPAPPADPDAPPVDKSPKPVTMNARIGLVMAGLTKNL